MKSYLARLVARAAPIAENGAAVSGTTSDPFTDTAEAGMEPPAAAPAPPGSSPRPPPSAGFPAAPPSEAPAGSPSFLTDHPPAISLSPIPPKPSATQPQENPWTVAGAESSVVGRPPERPSALGPSKVDDQSPVKASEAGVKEAGQLRPREIAAPERPDDDPLLDIADRFIDGLRAGGPEAGVAARATLEPVEVSQPLAPREFPGSEARPSHPESVAASAASLHIGNLQVDIVESSAASARPDKSPAPVFIVRNGTRDSGSPSSFRQRFGLRQL